ncbi:root hair initiation protein root hairless 1 (RHL1) [Wolffia australiana]
MTKAADGAAAPPAADQAVSRRLKSAAFSRKLLSRTPGKSICPLEPSKAVLKQSGRDIVKKGQRKNKFLFSLPGLLSPLSGGKIGELADLNTRNPVLYLEFPQGRMKLFGTVVYPKNKYLTLQFSKSSKGVLCEDSFENMVVFSEAWWIGTREENPDEIRLEFPINLNSETNLECDFNAGAGAARQDKSDLSGKSKEISTQISAEIELSDGETDSYSTDLAEKPKNTKQETPTRQSARTAGKSYKFAESSGDDSFSSQEDETKISELMHGKRSVATKSSKLIYILILKKIVFLPNDPKTENSVSPEASEEKQSQSMGKFKGQLCLKTSEDKSSVKGGALVQAKLSTMFDNAKKRSKTGSPSKSTRGSGRKLHIGAKKSTQGSVDSIEYGSPSGMNESHQETDDSDEDWTS